MASGELEFLAGGGAVVALVLVLAAVFVALWPWFLLAAVNKMARAQNSMAYSYARLANALEKIATPEPGPPMVQYVGPTRQEPPAVRSVGKHLPDAAKSRANRDLLFALSILFAAFGIALVFFAPGMAVIPWAVALGCVLGGIVAHKSYRANAAAA